MTLSRFVTHALLPGILCVPVWAQTQVDLRTQGKNVDFSAASSTRPSKTGIALPGTCAVGELFFKTDAAPGSNIYGCTSANVWTPMSAGGGGGTVTSVGLTMPAEFAVSGSPVTTSGTLTVTKPAQSANRVYAGPTSGAAAAPSFRALVSSDIPDVSGTYQARTEKNALNGYAGLTSDGKLTSSQGQEVWSIADLSDANGKQGAANVVQMFGGGATAAGDCAQFDAGGNLVSAGAPCGSAAGAANYAEPFTSQTAVTVAGSTHNLGTSNLIVDCYDDATPANRIEPNTVTVDPSTFDVIVTFTAPQSGKCVLNGSGGGAGGAVSSVFGRTGIVTAQTGDYSFAQISGTVSNTQVAAGVDAAKIGSGAVSNTEFGYLDGVTSSIQTQLGGKATASHSHTLAGDVSGSITGTTVAGLLGKPIAPTAPLNGQVLIWNNSLWQWEPGNVAGAGAASTSQLTDFQVAKTSDTVLTIGQDCTASTPCNVRFGNTVYTFTASATAMISAGSGTAYVYVAAGGALTVGHDVTLTCSGCTATSSVTSFPPDSVPLFTWTATNGAWDAAGGVDRRAFLSAKNIRGGIGVAITEAGGETSVSVDSAVVALRVQVPATATSPCTTGSWAADGTHFYVCVAWSTWRRAALSAW
jgi:hypothetical protein